MNLWVPAVLNTCVNWVPFGSLPLVLMNVSGPWYTLTLWPPSTTFQVTDSPVLIWLVVWEGFCQSMVTLAADAGEATASALAPAGARGRGMNFFMGTAALLEWDRTREQAFPAAASARARLFVQVRQPSSSRSPSGPRDRARCTPTRAPSSAGARAPAAPSPAPAPRPRRRRTPPRRGSPRR